MFRVLLSGPVYWVDPGCLPALSLLFSAVFRTRRRWQVTVTL